MEVSDEGWTDGQRWMKMEQEFSAGVQGRVGLGSLLGEESMSEEEKDKTNGGLFKDELAGEGGW